MLDDAIGRVRLSVCLSVLFGLQLFKALTCKLHFLYARTS